LTDTLTLTVEPPVTDVPPDKGTVYNTLELSEPRAGEMRVANAQVRNGINHQSLYLRNAHLISAVTKRTGQPWPVTAVEALPDGIFTEASDFLLGFQERAHMRALQAEMARAADETTN
jgi:hypothetical protein